MHTLDKNIQLEFELDPLIDAIRNNKAVVYVGAGASKSAGLPDWENFLKQCLSKAKDSYGKNLDNITSKTNFELAEKLLTNGDYLMSAELLQQEVGSTLSTYIWDTFGTKRTPSSIHKAIARIPFSLAITTNYDKLLEGAYNKIPNVFTWLDPQAIFSSIKYNRFAVIKTHGDVGNDPSVVLTKTHYRNLMHLNKAFNEEIISLLSLKTFLFIGSSLRDHDLLSLMDEAKLTYGNNFGPHYAFLFKSEVDNSFIRYLRDAYNIHVIVSDANQGKTESVCSFLKIISGRASEQNNHQIDTLTINSELFCFNKIIHEKLRDILIQTGAERGVVGFIDRRDLPGLKFFFQEDIYEDKNQFSLSAHTNTDTLYMRDRQDLLYERLLKACYYKGNYTQKYIYYPDVSANNSQIFETDIIDWDFSLKEETFFDDTKSILITQILSDGQMVGAIMIKSSIADAFTKDHLKTLKSNTVFLSAIFKELELRNLPLLEIDLKNNASQFQSLMDSSNLLRDYELSYLLYEIDHRNGRLVAHYDTRKVERIIDKNSLEQFSYNFSDKSLATYLLKNQQEIYFSDVQEGISEKIISQIGVKEFKIKGEIYATPVRVGNYNSFILVAWSRREKFHKPNDPIKKVTSSIYRLAHLIANSTDRAYNNSLAGENKAKDFIISVNDKILPIDRNKPWSYEFLRNEKKRARLYAALMGALVEKSCNLGRVRLWFYNDSTDDFSCIYSVSQEGATLPSKNPENQYINLGPTPASDIYCAYTLNRFRENPHSMHQHLSMFSEPDPNTDPLDKDPNGKWIVGPIVSRQPKQKKAKTKLLGFISADNHFIVNGRPKERILTEKEDAFQRYAVDLIADLVAPILHIQAIILEKKAIDLKEQGHYSSEDNIDKLS